MGYVAIAAQLLGGLTQGSAGKQAAKAEESLLKINAQLAGYDATEALAEGGRNAQDLRGLGNRLVGSQRAIAGSSGLSANEGSALDVQVDTAYQIELDAQRALYAGQRKAWGYDVQATMYMYQAKLAKQKGKGAFLSGLLGGASDAGGTAYSVYGK